MVCDKSKTPGSYGRRLQHLWFIWMIKELHLKLQRLKLNRDKVAKSESQESCRLIVNC